MHRTFRDPSGWFSWASSSSSTETPSTRSGLSEIECAAPSGQIGFSYCSDKQSLFAHRRAEELADLQHGLFRLLFLRHVSALVDDPEGGVRHFALELEPDLHRHDAIVVAPQNESWQFNRCVACRDLLHVVRHDLPRAIDQRVLARG